jgi:MtaA/CmuA family methyltransferase
MTGKQRIHKAFKLEDVDRTPWVPFIGVHGAKLINKTATEYLQSSDYIVDAVTEAVNLYKPDGIPVTFDLQIEAEALGCALAWADDNPPAVISHPLMEGRELSSLNLPDSKTGRIGLVMEATRRIREAYPDLAIYGLITGPFTLALHLMGTDIFIKMMEDPEKTNAVLDFCNHVAMSMADWYIEAGCDIIAVVDPMTSQIDPFSFETYVSPHAVALFSHIRKAKALSSFFVCGHAQHNIEAMCACKPDNISIDENIPLDYVRDIAIKSNVSFGGNMKLTVVLLMGDEDDSRRDALECMDLAGAKGFVLAPGCDLPMDTPVKNLKAVSELVKDPYLQDVVRAKKITEQQKVEMLDLSQRWKDKKVVVDIITLDSSSCAPCQYMVEAVKNAIKGNEEHVSWQEHSIKSRDGVQMMASLGVKNIPTICIDGNVEFISQIPTMNKLQETINNYIKNKTK